MILCGIKCGESITSHFRFILIHFLPRMLRLNPAGWLAPQPYKAKSIKFLDQDDTSGQHKLEGWLYIVFIINLSFNEETSFIGSLGDEAFYLANFEWGWRSFFRFISKTILASGWSFILWPMLYLEGWLPRSSCFIGAAWRYRIQGYRHSSNVVLLSERNIFQISNTASSICM